MTTRFDSTIGEAALWRADYEHCREMYGIASSLVARLRGRLVLACLDVRLTRMQRDSLLEVLTQIDDEKRGR